MFNDWYEVWVDESTKIPYILFLCPSESQPKEILIIEPKADIKVIQRFPDYETSVLWLSEDEYTLVKGRMLVDY